MLCEDKKNCVNRNGQKKPNTYDLKQKKKKKIKSFGKITHEKSTRTKKNFFFEHFRFFKAGYLPINNYNFHEVTRNLQNCLDFVEFKLSKSKLFY